jgi:hypothetical protein
MTVSPTETDFIDGIKVDQEFDKRSFHNWKMDVTTEKNQL